MDAQATYEQTVAECDRLLGRWYEVVAELAEATAEYRRVKGLTFDQKRRGNPKLSAAAIDARVDGNEDVSALLERRERLSGESMVLRENIGFIRQQLDHARTKAVTERTVDQLEAQWGT